MKIINKPKLIAFYLPQFHTIPENDKWWGKGFTEWTNVKKAKPLFKGHIQPKIPLNNNYYNLLDIKTLLWQQMLAKKYGIYGFCFYHYWFNGKKLLEKPTELLLKTDNFKIPFCFSWANESWTRVWDGKENYILQEQIYGDEKDWLKHFNYLNNFFKNKQYIKIHNKPMLLLYKSNKIPNLDKMITFFNKCAIKAGFDGVYITETLSGYQKQSISLKSNADVIFEPSYSLVHNVSIAFKIFRRVRQKFRIHVLKIYKEKISYSYIWNKIVKQKVYNVKKDIFLGAFVDWDNSPRRKNNGAIFFNTTSSIFEKYFKKLFKKAMILKSRYIFINAWNEWSEGAYLEPDSHNKYILLEIIRKILKK